MCHLLIRTICPSCHFPTCFPQRNRVKPCFPPKVYTGWAPATAMYEKHRTEEKTIPEVCDHCRYRELWTWYGGGEGEAQGETLEGSKDVKDVEGDDVKEGGKEGGKEVEGENQKVEGGKGKGKKVKAKKENMMGDVGGEEKGVQKGGKQEKEKKVPRKEKKRAGEDVDQQEVEYKRRRFP